jgi:hypothetical protein
MNCFFHRRRWSAVEAAALKTGTVRSNVNAEAVESLKTTVAAKLIYKRNNAFNVRLDL